MFMDFLKGIKDSITDHVETKNHEKVTAQISDVSDLIWGRMSAMSDNPDFKLDYDNMSAEELERKLDYYADRINKYMQGQINPHEDNTRFNDEFSLFQHIATKTDGNKYDLLLLESFDFRDRINAEYNNANRIKEEKYASEAKDIIDGKTDPATCLDRITFLIKKHTEHEWFSIELYEKLCDIESKFRHKELTERLTAIMSKQKPLDSKTKNDDSTSSNETIYEQKNDDVEKELMGRAEKYIVQNMNPHDNWPDYNNLLDLYEQYIEKNQLAANDPVLETFNKLINIGTQ